MQCPPVDHGYTLRRPVADPETGEAVTRIPRFQVCPRLVSHSIRHLREAGPGIQPRFRSSPSSDVAVRNNGIRSTE